MMSKMLSEITSVITKGTTPTSVGCSFSKIGINYIKSESITSSRTLDKSKYAFISEETHQKLKRSQIKENDILFSMAGMFLGKTGIVQADDVPANTNQAVAIIRIVPEQANYLYVYYYLNQKNIVTWINSLSGQSAQPNINLKQIGEIEIPLPDRIIQDTIVEMLSAIDSRIELNTAINENLEQQIQAILLNMIQQDSKKDRIETVKLGEYLYIKGRIGWKGLKKDEYLDSSDYRIINGESLTKDGIDWNKAGFISKERYDESPEIMLQVGDILLSKDGTIGKIGYVDNLDSPSTVASGIFVIRNIKPDIISTQFIYYLLKSKLFSVFIASRTEGSVIPHLYQKDFMEFAFPLPNADEMSQFDALTSPLFATIIKNLRENEFLTATRDALLPKLMNGEIDVSAVKI